MLKEEESRLFLNSIVHVLCVQMFKNHKANRVLSQKP